MPLLGAFPVPLVGMSMSPIIGFWAGIGALMAVCDSVVGPSAGGTTPQSGQQAAG